MCPSDILLVQENAQQINVQQFQTCGSVLFDWALASRHATRDLISQTTDPDARFSFIWGEKTTCTPPLFSAYCFFTWYLIRVQFKILQCFRRKRQTVFFSSSRDVQKFNISTLATSPFEFDFISVKYNCAFALVQGPRKWWRVHGYSFPPDIFLILKCCCLPVTFSFELIAYDHRPP